jgi:hypothetical protein
MVLKIGIKRIRDLGMLRPSRADLAAEAVLASLNCTRAWRHKTLFRRYHPDLSKKRKSRSYQEWLEIWPPTYTKESYVVPSRGLDAVLEQGHRIE